MICVGMWVGHACVYMRVQVCMYVCYTYPVVLDARIVLPEVDLLVSNDVFWSNVCRWIYLY